MNRRFFAAGCGVGLIGLTGLLGIAVTASRARAGGQDAMPSYIELTGVVRDFRERTEDDGHTDFERRPSNGFGHYAGNIRPILGDDRKPVFVGGGRKVSQQWRDREGRPICHHLYNPGLGDRAGSFGARDSGGIDSAESFNQWFRDTLGVNMSVSRSLTLRFNRQEDGSYVFDDKEDPYYAELGGFFPIDNEMFGNSGGQPDHNFHFTFELHTRFKYHADDPQIFQFIGDDDVWVFVDGRMVIDLGGVHAATEQYVDLSRLGLTDGETYTLDFFFAERHRTQSNFRIVTTLDLQSERTASISPVFD